MTSFVIESIDRKKREDYCLEYCAKLKVDKFDVTLIEKETSGKSVLSIGIDDIKSIHKKIFLKPLRSETKAIIIEEADLLTIEAQNALLKVLEEPPVQTIILLCVESKDSLLPTILSRCKIIEIPNESVSLSDNEINEYVEFINNLNSMKAGERLKKAEELSRDKDEATAWIAKLILILRKELIDFHLRGGTGTPPRENYKNLIKSFQELHTLLKTTNVNPRFAIENTLLNLN